MAGDDYAKQERVKMLAWAKPKAHRRKLIQTVTRLNANVIMCFRAKESSKPGKDPATGKSVVIPMGFVPMAAPELSFEMSLSMLFLPNSRGKPTWHTDFVGERVGIKLPRQFEWLLEHKGPINAQVGRRLAEWAQGTQQKPTDAPKQPASVEQADTPDTAPTYALIDAKGQAHDMENIEAWMRNVRKAIVKFATPQQVSDFIARNADAMAVIAQSHPAEVDEIRVQLMDLRREKEAA